MASDRDQWADNLSGASSGSWLTAFLADEADFDRRSLWRLGSWGVGTVGAVVVALLANQYAIGWRQEQVASADLARQSQQIQRIAKESQNETRRLASAVETLNSDRDRLYSRVTVLEQGLESVTGSIGQQSAAAAPTAAASTRSAAAPSASTPSSSSTPSASTSAARAADPPAAEMIGPPAPPAAASQAAALSPASPPQVSQAPSPPPAMAPSRAAAAVTPSTTADSDQPSSSAALSPDPPAAAVTASSQPAATGRTEPTSNAASAAIPGLASAAAPPPTPLMATKSILSPPDPGAAKLFEATPSGQTLPPLPAPQVIAAPGMTEADGAGNQVPAVPVQRTEFGVDLGGANSVEGLRALWRALMKNRSNKALADLRPIIVVKERSNGLGMQLRLVAGPINDAAAAAKLCAGLIETSRACETTVFDGQRLALKNDNTAKGDSSAAAPSSRPAAMSTRSLRKRGNANGAANGSANGAKIEESPAETAPPPPAKSTLTSILGLR